MKNRFDKYFKQILETPQPPPADAWEYIQGQLPSPKGKRRIFPLWLQFSGIAMSLLLMVGLGYWLGIQKSEMSGNPEMVVYPEQVPLFQESNTVSPSGNEEIPSHLSNDGITLTSQNPNHSEVSDKNQTFSFPNPYRVSIPETGAVHYANFAEIALSATVHQNFIFPLSNLNLKTGTTLAYSEISKNTSPNTNLLTAENQLSASKEKKKKKSMDFNRFHFSVFASPLSFNTFVGNSMLADEMSEFKTENSVTLAYGVKAGYSLSPSFKVRTGVSVVGLEQITNNVPLAVSIHGRSELTSIDDVNNVKYNGNVRIDNNPTANSLLEMELSDRMGYGDIQQQASYIEIPLEAELSLFQTPSIGISATGGGSTWLLSKNKIYVHMDDYTQELGEANNLNKVSFSANAGLKFDMNLTDNIKLNVEPNFRYLINPVNNIEKYNPYTVGVNAGLSISLK